MVKRLFLAINLPNSIKEQLFDLILKLQKNNCNKSIKWVKKENLHLTLHFLGSVPEEKIKQINESIELVVKHFLSLSFSLTNSIQAFPNLQEPKVIYLELNELNDCNAMELQKKSAKHYKAWDLK